MNKMKCQKKKKKKNSWRRVLNLKFCFTKGGQINQKI